jgi:hypothetical protein
MLSLTFASYLTFSITFNVILKLAPVPCFFPMIHTGKPSPRGHASSTSGLNKVGTFR